MALFTRERWLLPAAFANNFGCSQTRSPASQSVAFAHRETRGTGEQKHCVSFVSFLASETPWRIASGQSSRFDTYCSARRPEGSALFCGISHFHSRNRRDR
ncbi:hypothetical protein BJX68DRAFT_15928 [Aspergillus pseudodeflectus]|uniref:Secreted protein n=1 Tax=Aspergillus pseudodeflectus TaxID=176178 RepID=A0ABR4LBX8_9EURO